MKTENGKFKVVGLPTIDRAEKMNHKELLRVLKFCPASNYFGQITENLEATISLVGARKLTIDMIRRVNMQLIEAIPEQESA